MKDLKEKSIGAARSMTIWVNAMFLLLIAALPELVTYMKENTPVLEHFLGPDLTHHLLFILGVVNIILRFRTKLPLEAK